MEGEAGGEEEGEEEEEGMRRRGRMSVEGADAGGAF